MKRGRMINGVVVLLFAIVLCVHSCKKSETGDNFQPTIDSYDYMADLLAMHQFFINDPIKYYAEFGFLSLRNQFITLQQMGLNPAFAFARMMEFFDQVSAQQAINTSQWSPQFINKMQEIAPAPLQQQWVHAILFFTAQLDQLLDADPTNPAIPQLYMILGDGILHAINPAFFNAVAPPNNPVPAPPATYNELCYCSMHANPILCNAKKDSSDNDALNPKKKWREVTEAFNTVSNGECATLAAGLCLHKLKKIDSLVDGLTWYRISVELGAEQTGGAKQESISKYYEKLGFAVTIANTDRNGKTPIQQAKDAMDRGCNVKMVYNKGKFGHIEYVTNINVTSSTTGVVSTISWGKAATVSYFRGNYEAKSDGAEYGSEDFLAGTGKAHFLIYCPK